jgi:outer membrane protein OmpA-like peptidoglycan-associated protein
MKYTRFIIILLGLFASNIALAQMSLDNDILTLLQVESINSGDRISDIEIVNDYAYVASRTGIKKINIENDQDITEILKGDAKSLKVTKSNTVLSGFNNDNFYVNDENIGHIDGYNPLTNETRLVSDIEKYGDKMYVSSNDGILVFDLNKNILIEELNTRNSSIPSNNVNFLLADSENRLWVGTDAGITFKKGPDKKWSKQVFDKDQNYTVGIEDGPQLWFISDKGVYNIYTKDNEWRKVTTNKRKNIYEGKVNDVAADSKGNLYIASDILVKFNPETDETAHYTDILGIASKKCIALEADKNDDIWLGTGDAGLFKITSDPSKRESLLLTSITEESINCPGQGGATVKIAANGGVAPYTYKWSPAYVKGDNPSGLKPGKYQVSATDARGTTASTTVTIEDAIPITVKIINNTKASSANSRDGRCDIQVMGGLAPYTIKWDNGEEGPTASKLNFGFHYINITDANNCSVEHKINVSKQSEMKSLRNANLAVGEKLRIDNLYFEADSSAVKGKSIDALEDIFVFLTDNDQLIIEIGGHTNNIPPDEYCDKLSSARAQSVTEYLIRRGIPQERISYKGYGKRDPIASNNTAAGRKRNQRVEMKILDIKK